MTGQAQREAWIAGRLPTVEQVRPGTWSVPVPIPQNPLRYTLTYVLEAGSDLVVVDPGWDTDSSWDALVQGLGVLGAAPSDVTGVVVTHTHADHHGLSGRLREASGAWVAMHPDELDALPFRWSAQSGDHTDEQWLRQAGVPPDIASELAFSPDQLEPFRTLATPDRLLADGDLVPVQGRRIHAVWTPGHTPGHLCLHDEAFDLLLTGDHVLPRISPNIALVANMGDPPLAAYLASLERIARYDSAEVLPAHEYRFAGLAHRVRVLIQHHERRCTEILGVLERLGTATVWQVTELLTWSRGWARVSGLMRRAAIAETAAHLVHLTDDGRLLSRRPSPQAPLHFLLPTDSPADNASDSCA
ncbi:MAG TPA: MBL fold metallo-hydrolase [Kineosporiaceae bacterium]